MKLLKITFLFVVFTACNLEKIEEGAPSESCPSTKFTVSIGGNKTEYPTDVLATDDCGYVVCGITQSFSTDYQVYLAKVDDKGIQQWERSYGSPAYDQAEAVAATTDGGYVICGNTKGFDQDNYQDVYVIKTAANGIESWSRTFELPGNSSSAAGIVQLASGSYRVAYNKQDTLSGINQIGLLELDANGIKVSDKLIPGSSSHYASSMKAAADGSFIIAGSAFGTNGTDSYIVKLDAAGNRVWDKTFAPAVNNFTPAYDVVALKNNTYATAGSDLGPNDHDFNILLYDAAGNLKWDKSFGGTSADEALDIVESTDGNIVVAGYTGSFSVNSEVYLLKLSITDGATLWEKHFGDRQGSDVCLANAKDGGYIIAATGEKTNGNTDIFLYKTDKDGNFQ